MATEVTEGAQSTMNAIQRFGDQSLPLEDRGKRFTVRNVQVVGFRDGKVSDRWGSTDELGILQQLGLA